MASRLYKVDQLHFCNDNTVEYHWYVIARRAEGNEPWDAKAIFQDKYYINTELNNDQTFAAANTYGALITPYISWNVNEQGELTITTKENTELDAMDLYFVPFITYGYAGKDVDELAAATATKLNQNNMRDRVFVLRYNRAE